MYWCSKGRSADTAQRADDAGLTRVDSLHELLTAAEIIVSICPPAAAEEVAEQVAAHGFGGIYVDANAISPARLTAIDQRLGDSGATVVDAAIFGAPPTDTTMVTVYLAGPTHASKVVAAVFEQTTLHSITMTQPPPAASALKIAHSSYQKAARALAAVAHALADEYGVTEQLIAEGERNSTSPLTDPDYLPSVAARAWRWSPELRDAASAFAASGLFPGLALAAADAFEHWEHRKDDFEVALTAVLGDLKQAPAE